MDQVLHKHSLVLIKGNEETKKSALKAVYSNAELKLLFKWYLSDTARCKKIVVLYCLFTAILYEKFISKKELKTLVDKDVNNDYVREERSKLLRVVPWTTQ